jgi:hypothetical protein
LVSNSITFSGACHAANAVRPSMANALEEKRPHHPYLADCPAAAESAQREIYTPQNFSIWKASAIAPERICL